jgi:hypothetical protein
VTHEPFRYNLVRDVLMTTFPSIIDPVHRRSMANLAQFVGQSTANIIARNLGSYAWPLWISATISLFSLFCAISVLFLDKFLRSRYDIVNGMNDQQSNDKARVFKLGAMKCLPLTFWIVVLFSIFENAGVQSFVSIST